MVVSFGNLGPNCLKAAQQPAPGEGVCKPNLPGEVAVDQNPELDLRRAAWAL